MRTKGRTTGCCGMLIEAMILSGKDRRSTGCLNVVSRVFMGLDYISVYISLGTGIYHDLTGGETLYI